MKIMSELIKALYSIKAALLGENIGGNGGNNETNENGGKFDLMMSNIVAPDYICFIDDGEGEVRKVKPSELTDLRVFEPESRVICVYKERPSDNTKLYINKIYMTHFGDEYQIRYFCYDSLSLAIDTVENTFGGQYTVPQELLDAYCYNEINGGGGVA